VASDTAALLALAGGARCWQAKKGEAATQEVHLICEPGQCRVAQSIGLVERTPDADVLTMPCTARHAAARVPLSRETPTQTRSNKTARGYPLLILPSETGRCFASGKAGWVAELEHAWPCSMCRALAACIACCSRSRRNAVSCESHWRSTGPFPSLWYPSSLSPLDCWCSARCVE
jgi:hypothetical protein